MGVVQSSRHSFKSGRQHASGALSSCLPKRCLPLTPSPAGCKTLSKPPIPSAWPCVLRWRSSLRRARSFISRSSYTPASSSDHHSVPCLRECCAMSCDRWTSPTAWCSRPVHLCLNCIQAMMHHIVSALFAASQGNKPAPCKQNSQQACTDSSGRGRWAGTALHHAGEVAPGCFLLAFRPFF